MAYKYTMYDVFFDIESAENVTMVMWLSPLNNKWNVFIWAPAEPYLIDAQLIKERVCEVISPKIGGPKSIDDITIHKNDIYPLMREVLLPTIVKSNSNLTVVDAAIKEAYGQDTIPQEYRNNTGYRFGYNNKAYDNGMLAYYISVAFSNGEFRYFESDHQAALNAQKERNTPEFKQQYAQYVKQATETNVTRIYRDIEFGETILGVTPAIRTDVIAPQTLRTVSDDIIHNENLYQSVIGRTGARYALQEMTRSGKFADVRLLLGKNAKLSPSLKRAAAQTGHMILESDKVSENDSYITDADTLADFVAYNFVDGLNTKNTFEHPAYQLSFEQHNGLLERFSENFQNRLQVDSTNSNFITYIIAPNEPLVDSPTVDLSYPVLQNDGSTQKTNLLEYMNRTIGLSPSLYKFYSAFSDAPNQESAVQITGSNSKVSWLTNANGEYINTYVTNSIGGAHGEYADFKKWQKEQVKYLARENAQLQFKRSIEGMLDRNGYDIDHPIVYQLIDKKIKENFTFKVTIDSEYTGKMVVDVPMSDIVTVNKAKGVFTYKQNKEPSVKDFAQQIDGYNVIHVDVDSLYPTLLALLETFKQTINGIEVDPFGELLKERLKLKHELPALKDLYTAQDILKNIRQLQNKLMLNSATGIADATGFKTNITVNNKILAMRIIGNLLITALATALAKAGGIPISVNTDGIYVTNISMEKASQIIDAWKRRFSLSAEPEIIERFISKDSNNRFESHQGKIEYAGGTILNWRGPQMEKNLNKPAIVDRSIANYFLTKENPLAVYDENHIRTDIEKFIEDAKQSPEKTFHALLMFQWILISSENANSFVFSEDKRGKITYQHKVSRAFIVKKESPQAENLAYVTVNKTKAQHDSTALAIIKDAGVSIHYKDAIKDLVLADDKIGELDKIVILLKTPFQSLGFDTNEVTEQIYATEHANGNKISKTNAKLQAQEKASQFFSDNYQSTINLIEEKLDVKYDGDLKDYAKVVRNKYNKSSIKSGPKTKYLRASFGKYKGVYEDFHFEFHNEDLILTDPTLLDRLDIDAYVKIAKDVWSTWCTNYIVMPNEKIPYKTA